MSVFSSGPSTARCARGAVAAVAAIAAAAVAAPAAGAAVTLPHSIAAFYHRDFVQGSGFAPDEAVTVELLRNGVVIGTAGATTPIVPSDDPKTNGFDGLVTINHPGGSCWDGFTPTMQPGDVVRTTAIKGTTSVVDSTTVAGVDVTAKAAEDPLTGDIVVKGVAAGSSGAPLPLDQVQQRMVAGNAAFERSGARTLRAGAAGSDGSLSYDTAGNPTGTNWTARYSGLSVADRALAVGAESRLMWLGPNPTLVNVAGFSAEMTIAEVGGDKPALHAPAPGCPPSVSEAVTSVDAAHMFGGIPVVDIANQNLPLVVSGVSNGASTVSVTLSDGTTTTAPQSATPDASGTWSVTFQPSDVAGLSDGTITASGTYALAGGSVGGADLTILKDLVAPGAPTAFPRPGTYEASQAVTLSAADPSATVHYSQDPALQPDASSPTANPVLVTDSQTISAIAFDRAGNASPLAKLAYTITRPAPASGGPGTPAGQAATIIQQVPVFLPAFPSVRLAPAVAAPVARPVVKGLTVARDGAAVVRRNGLRVTMRLPAGTGVVAARLYRVEAGRLGAPVLTTVRRASGGVYRLTLRGAAISRLKAGRFAIEIQAGATRRSLGAVSRKAFSLGA